MGHGDAELSTRREISCRRETASTRGACGSFTRGRTSRIKRTTCRYNQKVHFHQPPNTIQNSRTASTPNRCRYITAPSDRPGAMWKGDPYWRARGNYVINWGQIAIRMPQRCPPPCPAYNPPMPKLGAKFGLPPFGFQDLVSPYLPKQTSFKDFTDGTSHTMLLSEVIQAANDERIRHSRRHAQRRHAMHDVHDDQHAEQRHRCFGRFSRRRIRKTRRTRSRSHLSCTNRPAAGIRAA